jgi:hypothetical protein
MSWRIAVEAAWLVPQLRRGVAHLRGPIEGVQDAEPSGRIHTG